VIHFDFGIFRPGRVILNGIHKRQFQALTICGFLSSISKGFLGLETQHSNSAFQRRYAFED
jgi:hypothetical protein